MPNFESVDFILDRAQATREVQALLAATWVWPDKSLAQWDTDIAEVRQARHDEVAAHAVEQASRGQRNLAYTQLERRMIQTVATLKIAARRNPAHAILLANLPEQKTSNASTLARGRAIAEAWRQINPTLVIGPDQTLAAFEAALTHTEQHDIATEAAKIAWRGKAELLSDNAAALDTDAKDWYALATRQFAPATVNGDLIRSRIPTQSAHRSAPAPAP